MTTYAAESAARNIRSNHEDRDQDQTVPTVETLTRETHGMLERTGVRLSPSRVGRLCRDYVNIVATKGVSFGAYLANAVALTGATQHEFDSVYYRLCYSDPTGESAVRRVLRGGRE
ncbi:hypothetical protein FB459_1266 [Yimella lutea]|uniref:Uncharacterized protein n=1 Tax=Yimella lutea TaxID=587872 RepID=A0A542EES8_9MICO|nr:hypothetical protein [Yimella lutea]TQJ13831.1 hypothetical protein FB459_1266 [Yimella lutea]